MINIKIWVDNIRSAPEGYAWCKSINEVKHLINNYATYGCWDNCIELIDIGHDAGDCAKDGGDYIRLLDWLKQIGGNYPIKTHSISA